MSTLSGGSIRILWDEDDSAEVTITGGNASFTVNGAPVTFPYTLASSTTFATTQAGEYTVSVQHYGYEIAGTPDGTRQVSLRFGEEEIFAPTPDSRGAGAGFASMVRDIVATDVPDDSTDIGAALSATMVPPFQLAEVTEFVRADTTTDPRPIDAIDGILYGATEGAGGKLWKSLDHGDTWTLVKDFGVVSAIQGLRALPDGEVLLLRREDGIFKSTGWAANPATATWANVVTPTSGAWILPWGVDVSPSGLCVAVEYAIPRDYSHNLWVSTNGGTTWTVKKDLKVMYPAPGDVGATHWHGVTIDTYATPERIWATHGDGYHGILYSDDQGATFTTLDTVHQPTAPVAGRHGIVAGTDEIPDGLQFIERRTSPAMAVSQLYTAKYPSGGLAYQAQRAVRDRLGRILVGLDAQPAGAPALLIASPDGGKTAYELYRWTPTDPAEDATLSHVVVDDHGYVYVVFATLNAQAVWYRGLMVPGSVPKDGPEPADKNSVMSKGAKRAEGSGSAWGVGADAGTDRGTATGYSASATGSRATATGTLAVASSTKATATGNAATASASGALASGADTVASAQDAVAIGSRAVADQARSVALGPDTDTTATDQVQVGTRHIELSEITDPAAPAADKARLYVVDSSGVTRLAYRTTAGILVVATKAEVDAEQARALAAEQALQDAIDAGISFSGETSFPAIDITGLTGAATQTRYVGGTASGPPTSGTFVAGDYIVTTGGNVWVCTTGGTPGTWAPVGNAGFVRKTADTARTSSATLANDPHLSVPVVANATYKFEAVLFYDGSTSGDYQQAFTAPAGATIRWGQVALGSTSTSSTSAPRMSSVATSGGASGAYGAVGAGTIVMAIVRGIVRTGGTAGSLTLQWAQGTSDATATTLYTDSTLQVTRVA